MSSVRLAPANVIRHCYPALAISLLVAGVGALSISSLSYRAAIPFSCGIGACDEVSYSRFAFVAGIPVADIGLAFFAVCIALGLASWLGAVWPRKLLLPFLLVGSLVCAIFFAIQALEIRSFCFRCIFAEVTCASAAFLATFEWPVANGRSARVFAYGVTLVGLVTCFGTVARFVSTQVAHETAVVSKVNLKLQTAVRENLSRGGWVFGMGRSEVVVFADMFCPACHFHLQQLLKRQAQGEGFRIRVRLFPMKRDLNLDAALRARLEYDPVAFLKLFKALGEISKPNDMRIKALVYDRLKQVDPVEAALARKGLDEDIRMAKTLGITSTPTFVVISPAGVARAVTRVPFLGH